MAARLPRPPVDLTSTNPVDYTDYSRTKGWSSSTAWRRKAHLPIIRVAGFPDAVIPAACEAVQAGERPVHLPIRRGRGRPRRGS
jgi:hypothetical protein